MQRYQYFVDVNYTQTPGPQHLTDDLGRACLLAMSEFLSGNNAVIYTAKDGFFEDPDGRVQSFTQTNHWTVLADLTTIDQTLQTGTPAANTNPDDPNSYLAIRDAIPSFDRLADSPESHPDLPSAARSAGNSLNQLLDWFDKGGKPPAFLRRQAD